VVRDLGDYQTPPELTQAVVERLFSERQFSRVLEPTCGLGRFLEAVSNKDGLVRAIGIELQEAYVEAARSSLSRPNPGRISVVQGDIFETELTEILDWKREDGPLLVVGNPPWITNAEVGRLNGRNRPTRTNRARQRGIDALTGASNFDLAEAVWLKLIDELADDQPTLALLCKRSTARRVFERIRAEGVRLARAQLFNIDSKRWFDISAAACLFVLELRKSGKPAESIDVYPSLDAADSSGAIGLTDAGWVSDWHTYETVKSIEGSCEQTWRQGVKHDAARLMELTPREGRLFNGFDQCVDVEAEYLFPLAKGSDLHHGRGAPRWVIVTQTKLGADTAEIEVKAPNLWAYLTAHREKLDGRKSRIYANAPPFAMFGVGDYTFAPFKVAVSGLHKVPHFRLLAPVAGKPVVVDDTSYFLPFESRDGAVQALDCLQSEPCLAFLRACTFDDAKRPITKRLLQRVQLDKLANQ